MFDKESIYDEEINPLVGKIIDICKRENIPFVMSFALREGDDVEDEDLFCTSAIYGHEGMMETPTFARAVKILKNEPEIIGFMIHSR